MCNPQLIHTNFCVCDYHTYIPQFSSWGSCHSSSPSALLTAPISEKIFMPTRRSLKRPVWPSNRSSRKSKILSMLPEVSHHSCKNIVNFPDTQVSKVTPCSAGVVNRETGPLIRKWKPAGAKETAHPSKPAGNLRHLLRRPMRNGLRLQSGHL